MTTEQILIKFGASLKVPNKRMLKSINNNFYSINIFLNNFLELYVTLLTKASLVGKHLAFQAEGYD